MKSKLKKMLKANEARTEIAGEHNTRWTPNAIEEVKKKKTREAQTADRVKLVNH
jgi:hypothetical protein